jgi:peptide-N4-(N-acetyl-beta-glucosaminyl)asparagine amidase
MTSDTPTLSMDGSVRFLQTIQKLSRLPFDYENDYNGQERALEVIPLEDFYRAAEAKQSRSPQWAVEDYVVQELVKWFKNDFFKWTNAPKCTRCDVSLGIWAITVYGSL